MIEGECDSVVFLHILTIAGISEKDVPPCSLLQRLTCSLYHQGVSYNDSSVLENLHFTMSDA